MAYGKRGRPVIIGISSEPGDSRRRTIKGWLIVELDIGPNGGELSPLREGHSHKRRPTSMPASGTHYNVKDV